VNDVNDVSDMNAVNTVIVSLTGGGAYVHTDITRERLNRIGHMFDKEDKFEGRDFVHNIGAAL